MWNTPCEPSDIPQHVDLLRNGIITSKRLQLLQKAKLGKAPKAAKGRKDFALRRLPKNRLPQLQNTTQRVLIGALELLLSSDFCFLGSFRRCLCLLKLDPATSQIKLGRVKLGCTSDFEKISSCGGKVDTRIEAQEWREWKTIYWSMKRETNSRCNNLTRNIITLFCKEWYNKSDPFTTTDKMSIWWHPSTSSSQKLASQPP